MARTPALARRTRGLSLLALSLSAALLALGCKGGEESPWALERSYESGPCEVVLRVSAEEVTIAQRVRMEIEARAPEGVEVEMPRFGEKLEQFGIADYSTSPRAIGGDGRVVQSRTYELEPFLSGDYRIPPMAVRFGGGPEGGEREVETEGVTVRVTSLLPEDLEKLEIRDVAGPEGLPRKWGWWLAGGALLLLLLAAVALAWWWRSRRERLEVARRLMAHEVAYAQLERLLGLKLVERGEIKAFYNGVSGVLRHYIEDRFGLRAPERTTEEFLREIEGTDLLEGAWKEILGNFLAHCDLVKFAEHQPDSAEIRETFDTCKSFIEATRADRAAPGGEA